MPRFITILISFLLLFTACSFAQRQKPEVFKILGVSVEGNTSADASAVIANSGLRIGDEITVPGSQVRQAIERLWALKIFSDVQIAVENQVENGVYLLIKVQEHPRLERVELKGYDDVDEDDIMKKVPFVKGQILTPQEINKAIKGIKKLYEEEGHLLAEITPEMIVEDSVKSASDRPADFRSPVERSPVDRPTYDKSSVDRPTYDKSSVGRPSYDKSSVGRPNRVVLRLKIDEGPTVKVREIRFEGNEAFSDGALRGEMEETKEKVWWMFWRGAKFDKAKYKDDKDLILKYYRKHGYIDAEILSDSLWYDQSKRYLHILINVHEGPQYKVRNIAWEGNTVYKTEALSNRLGFRRGDVYDVERFEQNLRSNPDQTDVASLYLDAGYLTFNLDPEIKRVAPDSVDINIQIYERNQFRLGRVDIKGNSKTQDKVIRRELYTRPGNFYSRGAIIRSMRQIAQLNYFNPEKLKPDYKLFDDKTVDLVYEVEEKSSDNVNASVGYSGAFGITGALGFTINNFDITRPFEGGAGQIVSFQWEFGEGARYRTFSLAFTEPWLFDTPTSFGVSLFDTRQVYVYDLHQTGGSLRLGRRFKWPDDYFRGDWIFRFQSNDVIDGGGIYLEGKTSQFSLTQVISRNSTDSPIFPTTGSNFSFSVEMSGGPVLPGTVDYHKWMFTGELFTPLFGTDRLVLYTSTLEGYLDGFRRDSELPPIELFFMGGTGLGLVSTTPLRGYEDRVVGPIDRLGRGLGGRVMTKQTAELRLAITLNPIPIYVLGFIEGGNVFEDFRRANFLDLKRSYGFGARLQINPIGMIGFDYGFGADDVYPRDGKADGWQFHFQFGRGF